MHWKERDMRILAAMLGGTISSRDESGTIKLGEPSFVKEFLLEYISENEYFFPEFKTYSSENAKAEDYRGALRGIVNEVKASNYDGILITHGTDTCAFFAQLAYRVLAPLGLPFVITGSVKSPDVDPEEAASNLIFAVNCLEKGNSGIAFRNADRIPKLYSAFCVTSPDIDGIYREYKESVEPEIKDRTDFLDREKLPKILIIPAVPGAVIPKDGFDRVLICCNHSGTAASDLEPLVKDWTSKGIQCFMAPIPKDSGVYESRKRLRDAGAVELPGMPVEGAWAEVLLR